jgi:hypothetical protein
LVRQGFILLHIRSAIHPAKDDFVGEAKLWTSENLPVQRTAFLFGDWFRSCCGLPGLSSKANSEQRWDDQS